LYLNSPFIELEEEEEENMDMQGIFFFWEKKKKNQTLIQNYSNLSFFSFNDFFEEKK